MYETNIYLTVMSGLIANDVAQCLAENSHHCYIYYCCSILYDGDTNTNKDNEVHPIINVGPIITNE